MKEFTFSYSVIEWNTVNGEDTCDEVICAFFKEELTEEQAYRLEKSYTSGKYQYLHEDKEIKDIYWRICDTIEQITPLEPDQEVDLQTIEYPEEFDLQEGKK